jgi:heptosyltransferase-2
MKKRRKILIVKTGFSEFLDRGVSTVVSLGDVLFCTTLLHLYEQDDVTWVVSSAAKGLLKDNPYIDRVIIFGSKAFDQIKSKRYDVFINLEKDIGICAFLRNIKAREKYGFYFNDKIHDIATYKDETRLLLLGQEKHKHLSSNSAEILYGVVGATWKGQGIVLSTKRRKKEIYDVGFNYSVGTKWPTKAWPMKYWQELERRLKQDLIVSWQKGHKNIRQYIHWIDSCRIIVSPDSLGQIVAQALGKEVVNLFGPTNHKRMKRIPGYHVLSSTLKCPYRPCYMPICRYKKFCMEYIKPKDVEAEIRRIFKA